MTLGVIPDTSALIQEDQNYEENGSDFNYDFENDPQNFSIQGGDEEHTIGRQIPNIIPNSTELSKIDVNPINYKPSFTLHTDLNLNNSHYSAYHFPTCYNNQKSATCNIPVISIFVCFFIAIALISIFGNFLVLYVVYKNSRMHRPPAVFKASLALADLLLSVLVIPSLVYNLIDIILTKRGAIPDFDTIQSEINDKMPYWIQVVVGSATFISMTASILTLLVMSIDRLVATRWPIYHRIHNSCTRAVLSITFVWVISIVPTILINIYPDIEFSISPYTFTYAPLYKQNEKDDESLKNIQMFGILYSAICWALPWLITTCLTMGVGVYGWKGLRSIRTIGGKTSQKIPQKPKLTQKISDTSTSSYDHIPVQKLEKKCVIKTKKAPKSSNSVRFDNNVEKKTKNVNSMPKNNQDSKNEDSSRRLVKTLCILVSMYTICVLPLTIMQLYTWSVINLETSTFWQHLTGDSFRWIWFISSCLFLLQSTFNIFIYHQSREFSEGLKNVFRKDDKNGLTDSSFFTSSRMGTARSKTYSKFKRRKLMPNVTMSTSDGANANRSVNLVMPNNNILPFKHDLRFNQNRYAAEPPKVLANIEKIDVEEDNNPSSVSSSTINSERPILSEKLTLGSNVGFVGKIMMEPISLTEGINSLKSMNSVNSLNTIKSDGTGIVGLKPINSLNTILKPISLKLEENECKSGFEEETEGSEHSPPSPDQTRDIIRTISTMSALPTRLLPTGVMSSLNEVDLMINNATIEEITTPPTTAVVTGDSGMDTISTNSSDIV